MLGEIKNAQHKLVEALDAYNRTIELDPNDYEAWLAKANILYEEEKLADAIDILSQAYRFNYDISSVNYRLAVYYFYNHDNSKATEYFEKGLSMNFNEYKEIFQKFPKTREFGIFKQLILRYKIKN
jgi:cytochrome c-type biogenesis protein CcmH/NrfG